MVTINIHDDADEYRIEIAGKLAGTVVDDILYIWKKVLLETASRRFIVDITHLTGYDYAGCSLLREMQRHGTHFSAASPLSLVFLGEISESRKLGPALVPKPSSKENQVTPFRRPRFASGE